MTGVIDLHAHALPPGGFDTLADRYPELLPVRKRAGDGWVLVHPSGRRSGRMPEAMFDLDARLAAMAAHGVDHQVVSAPPFSFFYGAGPDACRELTAFQNDALLELASASRGRLSVLAGLPLVDPDASLRELERVAARPEVRGVAIGTHVGDEELSAPRFEPLWAALVAADLGVLLHPEDVIGRHRMGANFLANIVGNPAETTLAAAQLVLGGVLERHPGLRVCLVHGGGFVPYQIGRWDHGWSSRDDVAPGLPHPPSHYLRRFTFDSILFDPRALEFLGRVVGWDRVAVGSDFPFAMSNEEPVRSLDPVTLSEAELADVLSGTAERFLRSPSPRSWIATA